MLEENGRPDINFAAFEAASRARQRRRTLLALVLLLVALGVVLLGNRRFWLPPILAVWTEQWNQSTSDATAQPRGHAPSRSTRARSKQHAEPTVTPGAGAAEMSPEITDRIVLPALQVEVISAGGRHQIIPSRNTSINIDLQHRSVAVPPEASAYAGPKTGMTNPDERVLLSPKTVELVSRPVEPSYPLLAKQMDVQGSVSLLARIDKDGNVQDLQVLSGPEILSAAAREAVRQWRFKPSYKAGRAMESQARVIVNFTISTH